MQQFDYAIKKRFDELRTKQLFSEKVLLEKLQICLQV